MLFFSFLFFKFPALWISGVTKSMQKTFCKMPDFWSILSTLFLTTSANNCNYVCVSSSSVFMSMASRGEGPSSAANRRTNRLAKERSPYLLQHAHNPVDWWVQIITDSWKLIIYICKQTRVMFVLGIRGDKRLLTKQRMKISQSFYQVRSPFHSWC